MLTELQSTITGGVMKAMIDVSLLSLIITAVGTAILIPILKKYKAKQIIHEDVPENHQEKSGTPTMGGIAIVGGIVLSCVFTAFLTRPEAMDIWVVLVSLVCFALLGFIDDFNKIVNKRNLGLTAKQKLLIQCTLALIISIIFVVVEGNDTSIAIPFTSINLELGYGYIPFMIFAIVAVVNSVNLTDGLDGLASGVSLIVGLFLGLATVSYSVASGNWFFFALAGACIGFLIFNKNPAKIFMGDTGSLAIGGGLVVCAFYANMEIILVIAGFVYVAEALSDIIQVGSYKLRNGKRVFKMAPLHHHFELCGWSEKKVVTVFMAATLILCMICSFAV